MAKDFRYQLIANGTPDNDLTQQATLIEVNQSFDAPSTFRIQFAVDICQGQPTLTDDPRITPSASDPTIAAVVTIDTVPICLVNGIVTNQQVRQVQGGPGSFIEITGQERRVVMNRQFNVTHHEGKASDIVTQILGSYGFQTDVADTTIEYSENDVKLAQAATDHDFVTKLAAKNNFAFWVDYDVTTDPLGNPTIKETAHFRPSPPRPQDEGGGGGGLPSVPALQLAPPEQVTIIVNSGDTCSNILVADVHSNAEAINQVPTVSRVNVDDATIDDASQIMNADNMLNKVAQPPQVRSSRVVTAGSVEEGRLQNSAAVTDASWSIKLKVDATAYAMQTVVLPHQTINLQGTGTRTDGPYVVDSVAHHIDVVDHKMSMMLKSNSFGTS
jgi:phage protein D